MRPCPLMLTFVSPNAFRFSLCSPVERLRQAFQILDPKNTGKVSAEHLRLLLRGIGCVWTEAKLAAALKSAGVQGTDRSGFCNCRERPHLMSPMICIV